jgi:hypothetical protein
VPGPIVPGAAAALVAAADHWEDLASALPVYADTPAGDTAPIDPVAEIPVAPVLLDARQAPDREHRPQSSTSEVHASSAVSLGFADGAQVDLDQDDPRVRTFRAAAAALLETPRT